jgi:YesN/AraC family two-component response regulator
MEYAQELMNRENKNIKETARILGYKNANNFITMHEKYIRIENQTSQVWVRDTSKNL